MVGRWKVLLTAFVIFVAGGATGAIIVRSYVPKIETVYRTHITPPVQMTIEHRMEYVNKLDREVHLTPDQRQKIEAIIAASQERMKKIWNGVEPQVKEEYRCSRRDITEVLTPEQREKARAWRRNNWKTNGTKSLMVAPEKKAPASQ